MSLNFNADGDKILTGSFDGTAIVLPLLFRSGTLNQENPFMSFKATLAKSQAHSSSSVVICAALRLLTRPAGSGMLEVENACQSYVDTLIKSWISTSTPLELV